MQVEFVGAVGGNVTGSRHIVHTEKARILLDCGLFQGRRSETIERNRHLGFRARDIDVMVLSHAHIDHSGALPRLYRQGFRGPIYCTPATRDLCAAMLEDSAEIFGDQLDRTVSWKGGSDLSQFAGQPVRLRFMLKDADLFSFRFGE